MDFGGFVIEVSLSLEVEIRQLLYETDRQYVLISANDRIASLFTDFLTDELGQNTHGYKFWSEVIVGSHTEEFKPTKAETTTQRKKYFVQNELI